MSIVNRPLFAGIRVLWCMTLPNPLAAIILNMNVDKCICKVRFVHEQNLCVL